MQAGALPGGQHLQPATAARLRCSSHGECIPGIQDCAPAEEDDTKAEILVCTQKEKMVASVRPVHSAPSAPVRALPRRDAVQPDPRNGNPGECQRDAERCGDDPACSAGKCSDGSPRVVPACPPDQCTSLGLECLGKGQGDAEAYRTMPHCTGDADRPGGFECAVSRDPHAICGTDKGDDSFMR